MKTPNTVAQDQDQGQEYYSPAQLAWRRLKKNKLAMLGLITVIAFTIMCFAAPVFSHQDPDRRRSWVGSLPPGSWSLDCLSENVFRIGEAPQLNQHAIHGQQINIQCREEHSDIYTITVYRSGRRKGTIKKIALRNSTAIIKELDLSQGGSTDMDAIQRPIPKEIIRKGEVAPTNLCASGKHVLILQQSDPTQIKKYTLNVTLNNEVVSTILANGINTDSFTVPYKNIVDIHIDGRRSGFTHMLGTDKGGRDVWSRILYGGRISLAVGIVATIVSLIIGVIYGAYSGYSGGRTDRFMMSAVDVLYAIPFMFVVILLLVMFGRNILILFAALGAVQWLTTARIVRGQILSLKNREFIEAAKVNGASNWCIIFRHLLPNCIGPIIVYATLTVPAVILEESFLAFLGLQVEWGSQKLDSWGYLVHEGVKTINFHSGEYWWLLVFPALAMTLTLLGLNTLGDGLRDALDPQGQGA
ncbi:MAG: ABC transporter permease [Planctomycetes bacterium]|nr:ABC transporter permease [Planctomycetota bacterium]